MATSQYERPIRSTKLPDIFRTAGGVNLDLGPTDRIRDKDSKPKDREPGQDVGPFPRIVLRDRLGRELDTFTSLQEAIYRAKWKVKQTGQTHNPIEWRLPKAPLPARPDYSRTFPPIRPQPQGVGRRPRENDRYSHDRVLEFDVDDVGFVHESLQHLPFVPSLSFLRQEILVGPKTYFQIVGTMLLHKRFLSQTEKRQAIYNFPGFCSGCLRMGLCYGCNRSNQPHFHEDKPVKTGGGFTYFKRDRPENEIASKHPSNWKILHPDKTLKQLMENYAGVNLEGEIPEEIQRLLDTHGGAISHDGQISAGHQRIGVDEVGSSQPFMEEDEGILPDLRSGEGRGSGQSQREGKGQGSSRGQREGEGQGSGRGQREGKGQGSGRSQRTGKGEKSVGKKMSRVKGSGGDDGVNVGDINIDLPETGDLDEGEGHEGQHGLGSGRGRKMEQLADEAVPTDGLTQSGDGYDQLGRNRQAGAPDFDVTGDDDMSLEASQYHHRLPKYRQKESDDEEHEESEDEDGEEKITAHGREGRKRQRLYRAPPPFLPKKSPTRRILAKSPFSSDRKLNLPSGKAFVVKKSNKKVTQFVDFNNSDVSWKPPKKFELKKVDQKPTKFWSPPPNRPKKKERKYRSVSPVGRKSPSRLSPDSGLESELMTGSRKKLRDKNSNKTGNDLNAKDAGKTDIDQSGARKQRMLPALVNLSDPKRVKGRQRSMSLVATNEAWPLRDSTGREELEPVRETTPPIPTPPPAMDKDRVATPSGIRLPTPEKPRSETPKKREIIKKERKPLPPRPKPPTPKPVTPPLPSPPLEPEPEPAPVESKAEPVRELSPPPVPDLPPVEIPALPEYKPPEKSETKSSKTDRRTLIEVTPELQEAPKKLKGPPKLGPRIKTRSTPRKQKVAEAPVTTTEIQQMTDPLDFLAKYCIINPDRLPYYERVFGDTMSTQEPRYSKDKPTSKGRGVFVSLPPAQLSQHELKMLKDLTVLSHAQNPAREGLNPPEQYLEKLNYSIEMLGKKREDLTSYTQQLQAEKTHLMAEMAKKLKPNIVRLDYKVKGSKKKKKPGSANLLSGSGLVIGFIDQTFSGFESGSTMSTSTTGSKKKGSKVLGNKKKKKPKNLEDIDALDTKFFPRSAKDITDDVIVSRIDDKMRKKLKKDPAVKRLTLEIQRNLEKDKYIEERLTQIDDEKDLVGLYCMDYYFSEQVNSSRPYMFRRQQSRLYQKLHPDPDIQMNVEEVQAALQLINNHLMTDKEFEYLYLILNLPMREKINFRLFSIIAALSEKVTQMDPVIRKLINKFDYNALDIKMEKSKELFGLLQDTDALPSGNALASSLAVELTAGGLTPEHTSYVLSKFNREGKGFVDFLDFVTYVPLFIEIHQRIITDPLNETLDI